MASIVPPLAEPPPAPVSEEPAPKRRRSLVLRILRWAGLSLLIFLLVSTLWVILYRFVAPPLTFTQLFDGNGATREWMPIERIDRNMVRAVIAAEDSKFCAHHGFDTDAIAAAMRSNAAGNRVIRGGSTISQQTAKNAFLWQGGGFFRKGLEAWFTLVMETTWTKRRIMEVYLNIAETGIGTYGVNAGAWRYFGHDASQLSPEEAARIAAVLPSPQRREAVDPAGFTRRYGNTIRARMNQVARDGLDRCVYE
jgi:monofunctional biosynthetic peptidoglycan transglycosylase